MNKPVTTSLFENVSIYNYLSYIPAKPGLNPFLVETYPIVGSNNISYVLNTLNTVSNVLLFIK